MRRTRYPAQVGNPAPDEETEREIEHRRSLRPDPTLNDKVVDLSDGRKLIRSHRKQLACEDAHKVRFRAFAAGWGLLLTYQTRLDEQHPEACLESLQEGSHWDEGLTRTVGRLVLEVPELVELLEFAIARDGQRTGQVQPPVA